MIKMYFEMRRYCGQKQLGYRPEDKAFSLYVSDAFGFFGANRYKKIQIEIPIADKAGFKVLLRDCVQYSRLKIMSEDNDTFLLKPKLAWTELWLWNERVTVTV